MWAKPYRPKCAKCGTFDKKTFSTKGLMSFWKTFLLLKQVFNSILLIFRLSSFGFPRFMIVRHVKPCRLNVPPKWQTWPAWNMQSVDLTCSLAILKRFPMTKFWPKMWFNVKGPNGPWKILLISTPAAHQVIFFWILGAETFRSTHPVS